MVAGLHHDAFNATGAVAELQKVRFNRGYLKWVTQFKVDLPQARSYIRSMSDFDPKKDAINLSKHGISLKRWVDLTILSIVEDLRFAYGEDRYLAYGKLDGLNYCLTFTMRNGQRRPISLRRVHAKEMKRHVPYFS